MSDIINTREDPRPEVYGIIYKATNIINNKCYIGQTTGEFKHRISCHLYLDENHSDDTNTYFKNAIKKYGKEHFEWEIIDKAYNQEDLNEKEIFWAWLNFSHNKDYGYNIRECGSNGKHSEETKEKISVNTKKAMLTEDVKNNLKKGYEKRTIWNKGKKNVYSVETLSKISESKKGKKFTTRHRENLSIAMKKVMQDPKVRKKIGESQIGRESPMKGKTPSEETKEKISVNTKKAMQEPKIKNKMKISQKNRWTFEEKLKAKERRTLELDYNFIIDLYFQNLSLPAISIEYMDKFNMKMSLSPIRRVLKELNFPMASSGCSKEKKEKKKNFLKTNKPEDFYI